MGEEVKPEVTEEEEKTVVFLPVCRRVAGEVVCEPKGLKVVYGKGEKPLLEEVSIQYPKSEKGEGEIIVVTSKYKKGVIGPIEVEKRLEEERSE